MFWNTLCSHDVGVQKLERDLRYTIPYLSHRKIVRNNQDDYSVFGVCCNPTPG